MDLVLVAAGLVALFFGGDRLVSGAVALAGRVGMPPMVIGLTIVGFGTSAPELVTSLQAALDGAPGIAVGNVVGSNIANILLILGCAALVAPMPVARSVVRQDGTVLAASTLLASALLFPGSLARPEALVLLAALALYLLLAFRRGAPEEAVSPVPAAAANRLLPSLLTFALGLALTLIGARLLVDGAVSMAERFGIPPAVIGLTVVAIGTSLPELVTSLTAAWRGHSDVALGNVIGSNLFNLLGILGVTAMVRPITPDRAALGIDLLVMIGATAVLLVFCISDRRISRREGAALLALYVGYLSWLGLQLA